MSTTSLEIQKQNLLKEIDSQELLDKVKSFVRREKKRNVAPCQYTLDELEKRLDQAEAQAERGEGITQGEMKNKLREWQA